MRQKFQQTVITLFDTEIMVSGSDQSDNELANWQEIAPGSYTFPFALKVPNVNFPPCIPVSSGPGALVFFRSLVFIPSVT